MRNAGRAMAALGLVAALAFPLSAAVVVALPRLPQPPSSAPLMAAPIAPVAAVGSAGMAALALRPLDAALCAPAAAPLAPRPASALIMGTAGLISRRHIDSPQPAKLYRRALRGLLEAAGVTTAADARPHFDALRAAYDGQVEGLGLTWHKGMLGAPLVISVDPGSPAEAAGLRNGDLLAPAGGGTFWHDSPRALNELLSPPVGSSVRLNILRPDRADGNFVASPVTLTAAKYRISDRAQREPAVAAAFQTTLAQLAARPLGPLVEAGLRKMAASLDVFTRYLDAPQARASSRSLEGERSAFGFRLASRSEGPSILAVMPGSPAARAGLQAGDILVSVDGRPARELSRDDLSRVQLRAQGRQLSLEVERPGRARSSVTLRAEDIGIPESFSELLPGGRGYLHLSLFTQDSAAAAIERIRQLRAAGADSLILDLRFNPGGSVRAVVDLAAAFLNEGTALVEKSDRGGRMRFEATRDGEFADLPLTVLVNAQSASASEIFAAAMQDHARARIVGEKTHGKGVGQETFELPDGAALVLTTFRWLSPAGRHLGDGARGASGLVPDLTAAARAGQNDELRAFFARRLFGAEAARPDDPALAAALR